MRFVFAVSGALVQMDATMTEEEVALMNEIQEIIDFPSYGATDMPEGTITTEPYFSDVIVPVMLAGGSPQGK